MSLHGKPEPQFVNTEEEPTPTPVEEEASEADPAPSEVPSTDVPIETTEAPAITPIDPQVTWQVEPSPDCRPIPDSPNTIASGARLEYECVSSLNMTGADIAPGEIAIEWNVRAEVDGAWKVALLPPLSGEWIESIDGVVTFDIGSNDLMEAGGGSETAFERSIEISYGFSIVREACDVTLRHVFVSHAVVLSAPGATVTNVTTALEPQIIAPVLADIPEPAVAFDGPLDFGVVEATADGPLEPIQNGALSVTVSGLDTGCGAWILRISAATLVDGDGADLDGASLVLVAVNDEPLAGGVCDLTDGCDLAIPEAGPGAPAEAGMALSLELRFSDETALGAFETTVDATLVRSESDSD